MNCVVVVITANELGGTAFVSASAVLVAGLSNGVTSLVSAELLSGSTIEKIPFAVVLEGDPAETVVSDTVYSRDSVRTSGRMDDDVEMVSVLIAELLVAITTFVLMMATVDNLSVGDSACEVGTSTLVAIILSKVVRMVEVVLSLVVITSKVDDGTDNVSSEVDSVIKLVVMTLVVLGGSGSLVDLVLDVWTITFDDMTLDATIEAKEAVV